jgi:hypothetical protein
LKIAFYILPSELYVPDVEFLNGGVESLPFAVSSHLLRRGGQLKVIKARTKMKRAKIMCSGINSENEAKDLTKM